MPSGLDIDHDRPLIGTIPRYSQHVVVRTGRSDWGSKIENEDSSVEGAGMNFAKSLKGLVGRGGKFHHVCMLGFYCLRQVLMIQRGGLMQARI